MTWANNRQAVQESPAAQAGGQAGGQANRGGGGQTVAIGLSSIVQPPLQKIGKGPRFGVDPVTDVVTLWA